MMTREERHERTIQENIEKLNGMFAGEYTVENGVMTWNSNGNVPFDDMLEAAARMGEEIDMQACQSKRDGDTLAFLKEYKEARSNMSEEQKREEAYERRAAFGPGKTIVDVFTGETVRT